MSLMSCFGGAVPTEPGAEAVAELSGDEPASGAEVVAGPEYELEKEAELDGFGGVAGVEGYGDTAGSEGYGEIAG